MFELDAAVAEWRRGLAAAGVDDAAVLDELEGHLRDYIDQQVAAGSGVSAAFRAGLARMGQPEAIEREFLRAAPLSAVLLAPPGQNLAVTSVGFLALSSLPIVMVMYPDYYYNAFSQAGPWTTLTWLNMAGLVALWAWAAVRLVAACGDVVLRHTAPPMHHAVRFGCIVSGALALALLPLAFEDHRRVLSRIGLHPPRIAVATAALCFCGAYFSNWVWDRWVALCRSPDARVTVERVSRFLCVFYGPILVGLFYLMWGCARWTLGYWPLLGPDYDPKGMPATLLVYFLIFGWGWLAPVAVILPGIRLGAAGRAPVGSWLPRAVELVATLLLIAAALVYFSHDPHRLLYWFMD